MLTVDQVFALQGALMKTRLQHPWHVNDEDRRFVFDCTCSSCQWLDALMVAALDFLETPRGQDDDPHDQREGTWYADP